MLKTSPFDCLNYDVSLELWCKFIIQSISHPSTIYNSTTMICVIWSVHLGCLVHIPLYHNRSVLVLCDRIGRSFLKWCGKLRNGTLPRRRDGDLWNTLLTPMAIRINARRSANLGTRCARRNSRRSCRQGVMHSLGRHERILLQNKKAQISTSGSNRDKSLWGHYCGKSAAMRTHASNQATRRPTTASLASVCVDSNLTRMTEARVKEVQSAIFLRDKE